MNCTHPVLYSRDGVLYCQTCGAVLPLELLTQPKEEPPKPMKKDKKKGKAAMSE